MAQQIKHRRTVDPTHLRLIDRARQTQWYIPTVFVQGAAGKGVDFNASRMNTLKLLAETALAAIDRNEHE